MSYLVTILRTRDGQPSPITRAETEAAVAAHGGLALKPLPRDRLEITAEPAIKGGLKLTWEKGELWARDPDPAKLRAMIELAGRLDARVRGDEFETYRTPEETYSHPDDAAALAAAQAETRRLLWRSRRRQWGFHAAIASVFVVLILVASQCSKK